MRCYKTAANLQRKKCFCKNKSKNRTRGRWHAKLNHHLALCPNSAPFFASLRQSFKTYKHFYRNV